jgi:hypothetical protein
MTTDSVVKILAVVGGGVVGGLGLGLLAQLLARAFTTKKLPPWPVLTVRLLGGIICGWLVALWLFGGGGPGIGGMGGWGFGSGSGKGDGEKTAMDTKKEGNGEKSKDGMVIPDAEKLSIEVLSKHVLEKLGTDESHCYRVKLDDHQRPMTIQEVKHLIKERQERQPPLRRIEIVLYKDDSPTEANDVVRSLKDWAKELKVKGGGQLQVDISQPDANAPLK